ncbi:MAG: O-antigen ligase family protein [Candidatus Aceula meridiana]|nr:O-antigen ligase family protein [Candidatus Aceula meridiana]
MSREKIIKIADKIIEYSIYSLVFFIPISIAGVGISCVFATIAFFVKKSLHPDFSFIKDNKFAYVFLSLFIMFMALSLINSGPYLSKSLRALGGKWIQYLFIFIIVADTFRTPKRIKNVIILALGMLGWVTLSAWCQKFLGFEFFRGRSLVGFAVTGPFKNPNDFGAYLVFYLLLILNVNTINFRNKIYRFFALLILFLSGGALLLALSRGAWLGFLLGGFLLVAITKKYKYILSFLSLFFISVAFLSTARVRLEKTFSLVWNAVSAQAGGSATGISAGGGAEGSVIGDPIRFTIWQGAIDMIRENPFLGKGLGTFMSYFEQYSHIPKGGVYYAHNCYLQMAAESGIFSFIFFLCFVGFILYRAARLSFVNRQKSFGLILGGLTAGLFGFLVHSTFDTQLYSVQPKALFWVMLGLTQATYSVLLCDQKKL